MALRSPERLCRARWVVPVTRPPIADGAVAVGGGRIVAVGPYDELGGEFSGVPVRDYGEATLLPGLVNAHTHLDNAALAGHTPRGGGDFVAWLEALTESREAASAEKMYSATEAACRDLLSFGTAAVADISHADVSPALLERLPIHAVVFVEVLGFTEEKARQKLLEGRARLAALERRHEGGRLRFALYPHALFTTREGLLREVFEENFAAGRINTLHVAESREEEDFLTGAGNPFKGILERRGAWDPGWKPPGRTSVRYLDDLGLLRPGVLVVHCVQPDDEEIGLLARSGCAVCLCPRSNAFIGVGRPRAPQMLAAGIELCLGTDGPGSVESLSLFDEMAFVSRHFPEVPPAEVLRMATVSGARALGLAGFLGAIAPGLRDRLLVYNGDAGGDPVEALTAGIDHSRLGWISDEYR